MPTAMPMSVENMAKNAPFGPIAAIVAAPKTAANTTARIGRHDALEQTHSRNAPLGRAGRESLP